MYRFIYIQAPSLQDFALSRFVYDFDFLHLPTLHPFIKPDQFDPWIKNWMKSNVLSTIFTLYGKPDTKKKSSNYRYP